MSEKMSKGDRLQKIRGTRGQKRAEQIKAATAEGISLTEMARATEHTSAPVNREEELRKIAQGQW